MAKRPVATWRKQPDARCADHNVGGQSEPARRARRPLELENAAAPQKPEGRCDRARAQLELGRDPASRGRRDRPVAVDDRVQHYLFEHGPGDGAQGPAKVAALRGEDEPAGLRRPHDRHPDRRRRVRGRACRRSRLEARAGSDQGGGRASPRLLRWPYDGGSAHRWCWG